MFVCLAFVIPLRVDFKWIFGTPVIYVLNAVFVIFSTPDSLVELLLNILVVSIMYFQATTASIFAVFILNMKVFKYGFKKVDSGNGNQNGGNNSFPWARTEFLEATSYLNSTGEDFFDGTVAMSDRQIKREIKSYGIFSIHIEEDTFPCIDLDEGER